jgi:hypothetical protein
MGEGVKWIDSPDTPADAGWAEVLTPLGASVHVRINGVAWDVCTEWALLHSGRGMFSPTDPVAWFGDEALSEMPPGIAAELYASYGRRADLLEILEREPAARAHILELPAHVFGAEPEEWLLIGECTDLARSLETRAAARAAAREASGE